jgi:GNAT superfamily N-acetyltransferase
MGTRFPTPTGGHSRQSTATHTQLLTVAEVDGQVVGTLQLTFIPSLTYTGGERAQIEGVRVDASHRGRGLGREMVLWAIERARTHGCRLVQLTTDQRRPTQFASMSHSASALAT